ncbi:MAG TPA: hypothetical protein VIC63_05395 [Candidatus Limnocylindria bacterium]|jgi:hypothetical protein
MRLRPLLGAALAALILTACQPSASPSPSAAPSDGSGAAFPSFEGDPELEGSLPASADGITFIRVSMTGSEFVESDVEPRFLDFLEAIDADIEDVSVAVALGANNAGDKTASILAFRIRGAEAADLVEEFKATADAGGDPLVWEPQTIGGKQVEVAQPNDDFPTPIALYEHGEVLYFVSSSDEAAFEAILSKLP